LAPDGEARLVERYFLRLGAVREDVVLGIGDDAAVLRAAPGMELVQTTDSLVEGVHFPAGASARSLGHRALAVNLSDLAAMGAEPAWALLSLTLPQVDEGWLLDFARGFGMLAREHGVALVGGNLSRGPLNIGVTLTGQLPSGTALRRDGGRAGDELWLSGTPGDAAQGLAELLAPAAGGNGAAADDPAPALRSRFEYPQPRVALGRALRGLATACIDVSDGVAADLLRLAAASGCGATLDVDALPVSTALRARLGAGAWQQALCGGEDYELCFSVPAGSADRLQAIAAGCAVRLTRCGNLVEGAGLDLRQGGTVIQFPVAGHDHFGGAAG
jgi:thiamine-monophosphate kinase